MMQEKDRMESLPAPPPERHTKLRVIMSICLLLVAVCTATLGVLGCFGIPFKFELWLSVFLFAVAGASVLVWIWFLCVTDRIVQIGLGACIKEWFTEKFTAIKDYFAGLFGKKEKYVYEDAPKLSKGEKFRRGLKAQSGWLFVTPALILMAVFTFYPIIAAFINSFKQGYSDMTGAFNGWGFDNFVRVLKGDTGTGGADFVQCLVNTLVLTLVSVPLSTLLALLISVALNSIKKLQKAYQTILFLPYLTNALAMGAVFATFFKIIGTANNTETVGIVNIVLGWFGIPAVDWVGLSSPHWQIGSLNIPWAKYVVAIVYEVWSGLPFKILILFSAMQSINKQYYEAAKVDGASRWTVLWKITAPMIMPQISYLLVTGIMGGMKQYSAIVGLFGTSMGMDYDMGTMVGYLYRYIELGQTGYAFAGSLILFVIIMVITWINNLVTKKRTTYK